MDQSYNLAFSNCEHFVTEVRTGELNIQVWRGVELGVGAAAIEVGMTGGICLKLQGKWIQMSEKLCDSTFLFCCTVFAVMEVFWHCALHTGEIPGNAPNKLALY